MISHSILQLFGFDIKVYWIYCPDNAFGTSLSLHKFRQSQYSDEDG